MPNKNRKPTPLRDTSFRMWIEITPEVRALLEQLARFEKRSMTKQAAIIVEQGVRAQISQLSQAA